MVENVLAFDEGFWVRLAARIDLCKSDDDKAWFSQLDFFFVTMECRSRSLSSINLTL